MASAGSEPSIHHAFQRAFRGKDVELYSVYTRSEADAAVRKLAPDVIILDLHLPDATGLETFHQLRSIDKRTLIVLITGHGTTDLAIEAMKHGAFEYLLKPLELPQFRELIENAIHSSQLMRKLAVLPAESPASAASDQLIGQCPSMQELYKGIGRVAAQEVKGVGPLGLLAGIPAALQQLNPEIALIGGISLLILFGLPMLPVPGIRRVPVQLVVLTAAIGIGMAVDLEHKHTYLFPAEFFGLPMISEIVRSKANIDNGSHTRNANMFHGLFLLAFVLLLPSLIHQIPLAALGAMLVYTRFRLASPKEFIHTLRIGPEQLVVFVGTILATDLLLGIAAGIALEVMFHLWHGTPFSALFRPDVEIVEDPNTRVLVLLVKRACVFSNWLAVRNSIVRQLESVDEITVDLSEACFVDHSVLSKLHDLSREFSADGKRLVVAGLENHRAFSTHPQAARKQLRPATSDSSGIVV